MAKIYAQVGSFAMKPGTQKGVHLFAYQPAQAQFTALGDFKPEINAGQNAYNPKADVLYVTHESKDPSAGALLTIRLDHETGAPCWLSAFPTCANQPSDVCVTQSGRYAVVPHHGSGQTVAKTVRGKDGGYTLQTVGDDVTLALLRLGADGVPQEICDVARHEPMYSADGTIDKQAHLHSCVQSPDGKMLAVCDKGMDRVYSYRVDEENGRLQLLCTTPCEQDSHPRYSVFHPQLPILYQNNEISAFINVWRVDTATGALSRQQRIGLLATEEESAAWTKEGASDLCISADGQFLYAAVRGLNLISVLSIAADGTLAFVQNIDCGGSNPRGLAMAPDGRYLFALLRDSNCMAAFARQPDGTLTPAGTTPCPQPGNMQFIVY